MQTDLNLDPNLLKVRHKKMVLFDGGNRLSGYKGGVTYRIPCVLNSPHLVRQHVWSRVLSVSYVTGEPLSHECETACTSRRPSKSFKTTDRVRCIVNFSLKGSPPWIRNPKNFTRVHQSFRSIQTLGDETSCYNSRYTQYIFTIEDLTVPLPVPHLE